MVALGNPGSFQHPAGEIVQVPLSVTRQDEPIDRIPGADACEKQRLLLDPRPFSRPWHRQPAQETPGGSAGTMLGSHTRPVTVREDRAMSALSTYHTFDWQAVMAGFWLNMVKI
jgi:hypothetical protein